MNKVLGTIRAEIWRAITVWVWAAIPGGTEGNGKNAVEAHDVRDPEINSESNPVRHHAKFMGSAPSGHT